MTPTLSTGRLTLRPLTKATQRNLGWLRDPDVIRYSQQQHREHTLSTQLRYINSFTGGSHIWAIVEAETGEHIGNVTAEHDVPNNVSDVGIMIGETAHWGKGYGAEAWKEACGWLLDKSGGNVRKLEAGAARTNEAMLKIMRGSQFVEEGERKNRYLFAGNPVSAVLFGRSR